MLYPYADNLGDGYSELPASVQEQRGILKSCASVWFCDTLSSLGLTFPWPDAPTALYCSSDTIEISLDRV